MVQSPLTESVLVLNKYYSAIRIVNAKRAFALLYKNNAEAVEIDNSQYYNFDFSKWITFSQVRAISPIDHETFVHTPNYALLVPKVIRLVTYDKLPRREVKFNRKNILARDENRCQYCGRKFQASQLSIDHVIPKSRNGKSSWANVVTACNPCNTKKGGRSPQEAGMRLIKQPAIPKKNPVIADKVKTNRYKLWQSFLSNDELSVET
ncbi:MAG: HNH endonuclease [Planctomycetes bacterium RBG_16_41_13]|nr:MAG: HNH endonuclease [Planctomycetes bacterium RBG_16_41_13]